MADPAPQAAGGIVGGPGNQGSNNTAHMAGQAGTSAAAIALPMGLSASHPGRHQQ
jgi:hypothetical protein